MKQQGQRFNSNKPKWSLVPQSALLPMVEVLEFGAKKYSPNNWKKGLDILEICESLKRHLDAFMEGEDNDPESNLSHIGHIQCNAMFLSWMMKHRPELDTRKIEEKDIWVCSNCGSDNVETKHWVGVNDNIIGGVAGYSTEDIWCNNCEGHFKLKKQEKL